MATVCDLSKMKNVYFAGIGGISMSSLALILKSKGILVSGYDIKSSETTSLLEKNGITIHYSFEEISFPDADTLVYTAAIKDDHPALVKARQMGIDIFSRAELLGAITADYKYSIGVAGTHGKSSTTGFLSEIMRASSNDATILAGAVIPSIGSTFKVGNGDCAVFEACEYKNSYHSMFPNIKVILNVELDHVDFFGSLEKVIDSFRHYIDTPGKDGSNTAIVNLDSKNAVTSAQNTKAHVKFFSLKQKTDYWADNIEFNKGYASFDLMQRDEVLTRVSLSVPGIHNVANALAAAAAAICCNMDICDVKSGLEAFCGVKRRFEKVTTLQNGAVVVDDYAHHPDEITVTLNSAKQVTDGKVICIFQPHTYSRTHALLSDFAKALSIADKVLLAPIYAARETNTYGISSQDLAKLIPDGEALSDFAQLKQRATELSGKKDIVITMGAGDVYKVFQE